MYRNAGTDEVAVLKADAHTEKKAAEEGEYRNQKLAITPPTVSEQTKYNIRSLFGTIRYSIQSAYNAFLSVNSQKHSMIIDNLWLHKQYRHYSKRLLNH